MSTMYWYMQDTEDSDSQLFKRSRLPFFRLENVERNEAGCWVDVPAQKMHTAPSASPFQQVTWSSRVGTCVFGDVDVWISPFLLLEQRQCDKWHVLFCLLIRTFEREFCVESHLISTRISLFCDSHQDSRKSCSFPASVLIFECCAN